MDFLQIVLLALVQGITEFLPISSSAHLILAPHFFGYADQGLAFDVAVHVGSLMAIMLYFRQQIILILQSLLQPSRQDLNTERKLGINVLIATLPIIVVGLLLKHYVETDLRSVFVIALATVGFGVLLLVVDLAAKRLRDEHYMTTMDALIVGLFQCLAIIPGTSRSGITMTAGLMLGLTREAATRFSFLLSIPTIMMSGSLVTLELILSDASVNWADLFSGILLSFIAAYLCIHLFLKFIEKMGMWPFVAYRFALGAILFYLLSQGA